MNADNQPDFNAAGGAWAALKASDILAIVDGAGDIPGIESESYGLYRDDTRVLSRWLLTVGGHRPRLLSSAISRDHVIHDADLSNPELSLEKGAVLQEGTVHLERAKVLCGGTCYEQITLTSFNEQDLVVPLEIGFSADFRDIFEVRGARRNR